MKVGKPSVKVADAGNSTDLTWFCLGVVERSWQHANYQLLCCFS